MKICRSDTELCELTHLGSVATCSVLVIIKVSHPPVTTVFHLYTEDENRDDKLYII